MLTKKPFKKGHGRSPAPFYAAGGAGPPPSGTTWSPTDKASTLTLSNGNLTSTANTGSSYTMGRGTVAKSSSVATGVYWEIKIDNCGSGYILTGIDDGTGSLTNFDGSGAGGWGWFGLGGNGYFFHNGGSINTPGSTASSVTFATGDVLGFVMRNDKLYRSLNGVWLDSGDPTSEVNGYPLTPGSYFNAISISLSGDIATLRCLAASQTYAAPSGCAAWN